MSLTNNLKNDLEKVLEDIKTISKKYNDSQIHSLEQYVQDMLDNYATYATELKNYKKTNKIKELEEEIIKMNQEKENEKHEIARQKDKEMIKLQQQINEKEEKFEELSKTNTMLMTKYAKLENQINDKIDINSVPEYLNLKEKYEQLESDKRLNSDSKEQLSKKIKELENELQNKKETNLDRETIEKEYEAKMRKQIEEEIKGKYKSQTSVVTRNKKMKDKQLNIMDRYPVKIYSELNGSEILKFVASEGAFMIKFQYDICRKIDKAIEDITLDDIFAFKVKYGELSDTTQEKNRFKNKMRRCNYLYDIYDEKLCHFKISLYYLGDMSENDWKLWIEEFHKLILNIYPDFKIDENKQKICQYVYKMGKRKGERCGKYNCSHPKHK